VAHGIFYTLNYLKHLEDKGLRVVNGSARSRTNFEGVAACAVGEIGLPYPKARVINHPSQAASAAEALGIR